jgi:glycosyltransferase involved in cell wall biosynthesis
MKNILIVSAQPPSLTNGGGKLLYDRITLQYNKYNLFALFRAKNNFSNNLTNKPYFKELFIIKKVETKNFITILYRYILRSSFLIYYIVIKNKISVIQLEYYETIFYSIILQPLRIIRKFKIFYTVHDFKHLNYDKCIIRNKLTRLIEKICIKYFIDKLFVWGCDDKNEAIKLGVDKSNIKIIPPIIKTDFKNQWRFNITNFNFVFLGSLTHNPNLDSLNYILRFQWPVIKKIYPDSLLYLVTGANYKIQITNKKNIINCGYVPNIEEVFSKSNILLAPIVSGTGIKVKIVEAFSYGIPVLSTKIGYRNFDGLDKNKVLISDSPSSTSDIIKKIRNSDIDLSLVSKYEIEYSRNHFKENNIESYDFLYEHA